MDQSKKPVCYSMKSEVIRKTKCDQNRALKIMNLAILCCNFKSFKEQFFKALKSDLSGTTKFDLRATLINMSLRSGRVVPQVSFEVGLQQGNKE
jgi:hypothetical protein